MRFNNNRWTHGHYINCVFVLVPDGEINICLLNIPDAFHDSVMADYGIYGGMKNIYQHNGGQVVVGLAFNFVNKIFLIKSFQEDPEDCRAFVINCQRMPMQ